MALAWLKAHDPGIQFNKLTIERLGLFSDLPGISPKLKKPDPKLLKGGDYTRLKGKQFTLPGHKIKCGDNSGYFEDTFKRIFVGEAIVRRKRKGGKKKDYERFLPNGPSKKHATPGDYFGCFSKYSEFQLLLLKKKKKERKKSKHGPLTQFLIQYPGYFSKYPSAFDPRTKVVKKKPKKKTKKLVPLILGHYTKEYFDANPYKGLFSGKSTYVEPKPPKKQKGEKKPAWKPAGLGKKLGGGKFGGFDKYPKSFSTLPKKVKKHADDATLDMKSKERNFKPQVYGHKTYYTTSVMQLNAHFRVNIQNCGHFEPIHVSRYVSKIC